MKIKNLFFVITLTMFIANSVFAKNEKSNFSDVVVTLNKGDVLSKVLYDMFYKEFWLYGKDGVIERVKKLNPGVNLEDLEKGQMINMPVMPSKQTQDISIAVYPPGATVEAPADGAVEVTDINVTPYKVKRNEFISKIISSKIRTKGFRLYGKNGILARAKKENPHIKNWNDFAPGTKIKVYMSGDKKVVAKKDVAKKVTPKISKVDAKTVQGNTDFSEVNFTLKKGEVLTNILYKMFFEEFALYGDNGAVERVKAMNAQQQDWAVLEKGTVINVPVLPAKAMQDISIAVYPPGVDKGLPVDGKPDPKTIKSRKYVVKKGETISSIVAKHVRTKDFRLYGAHGLIARAKRQNPHIKNWNTLKAGTKVKAFLTASRVMAKIPKVPVRKKVKDTEPPALATELLFEEGEESEKVEITAKWIKSESLDLKTQKLQFYNDKKCGQRIGMAIDIKSNELTSYIYTANEDGYYSYKVISIDKANNQSISECSPEIEVDAEIIYPATEIAFVETSPLNTSTVNLKWKRSDFDDLDNQKIQFYLGANCTEKFEDAIDLDSDELGTYKHEFSDDGTYSYKVVSIDDDDRVADSECSPPMVIDTSAPVVAKNLGFKEGKIHTVFKVTPRWSKSSSPDLDEQKIQYYNDKGCKTPLGEPVVVEQKRGEKSSFVAPKAGIFSFKVVSIDAAKNESISGCSSLIEIDSEAPNPAIDLEFAEGTLYNDKKLTAKWTKSDAYDLNNQTIQFYSDEACSSRMGGEISLNSKKQQSYARNVGGSGKYSFKVTSIDRAGIRTVSNCSQPIEIDVIPPTAAMNLAFVEGKEHKKMTITAGWDKSSSTDLDSQKVQFYFGEKCDEEDGDPMPVSSDAVLAPYVAPGVDQYSFKIVSVDKAGNESTSGCSDSIQIDHGYTPFALILDESEVERAPKGYVYIGDRFFIEGEAGYVKEDGQTERAPYNTYYGSSRVTFHGKPFAFWRKTKRNQYLANLVTSVWYQRGVIPFTNVATNETIMLYPVGYGAQFSEFLLRDFPVRDLQIGPQVTYDVYEVSSKDPTGFRGMKYSAVKLGLVMNYDFPRLLSNLTVDFNYAPIFNYEETPTTSDVSKKSMYDLSFRFLRKFSRKVDLGFGYDLRKINVDTSAAQAINSTVSKLGFFLMWHWE